MRKLLTPSTLPGFGATGLLFLGLAAGSAAEFTRLEQLPAPKIASNAEPYPGGHYEPANLVDGNPRTEYSSNAKGTNTFVEFDFGAPTQITAFQHTDRNDPATVSGSALDFLDASGNPVESVAITHLNQRAGTTFFLLPAPVTAQRVRWHITGLGGGLATVGGAEVAFFKRAGSEATPTALKIETRVLQLAERSGNGAVQPLRVEVQYPYAETVQATLRVEGAEAREVTLKPGEQIFELKVPTADKARQVKLELQAAGQTLASRSVTIEPVRKMEIYILPHSHNDIGYTALQDEVVKKQNSNIETGLRLAKATANYPEGSRFVWNVEVLWCVDNYLRVATPEQRQAFFDAVKAGQIGLDAFYCNILTGLCRPEELLNLMRYATKLSDVCGVPVESAMISDVPGYTWSTVSAMAQAGVKYFSFAPNYFDRMGGTMKEWQNRPFWWKGPDGRNRVLCWCPSRGYALGHLIGDGPALARFIPEYLVELQTNAYPYDITYLRWNVHGDNGSPDERVSEVVRDWNARYLYPRLIITKTATAFRAFEKRYGDKLPEFSGDYTPYWEDGAASSAFETALNRASADRLTQAETLWAMLRPGPFPAEYFEIAWRNILLYSEHTWGAHNSISQPDIPFVREQWRVKQAFALDADNDSRQLLAEAAAPPSGWDPNVIDVFNTSSWQRTDLVTLSPGLALAGDRVLDEGGKAVPSQRLSNGRLAFLARDVPPFAARRYKVTSGAAPAGGHLKTSGTTLESADFRVRIDERTGGIQSLFSRGLSRELAAHGGRTALNDYFYLPGSDLKKLQRNGVPRIRILENGPLVVSLLIESSAPGCKRLAREVRLIDGVDRVELINTVDKLPVRAKEGLHFGYAFEVPQGTVRMDVGWAQVRPELDQIPASCKNWFSVQRWLDISNDRFGITWAPVDAPLVELGDITANLVGSQTDWRAWIQHLEPTQTVYSWVMNNHWHTNYRADQEGPTVFHYAIRAHKQFAAEEAARFGVSCSQPLVAAPAASERSGPPRLKLSSDQVLVAGLKPADDNHGWIVRLFGASGKTVRVKLAWSQPAPTEVWLSDTSEKRKEKLGNAIEVPGWGIVTLRAQ